MRANYFYATCTSDLKTKASCFVSNERSASNHSVLSVSNCGDPSLRLLGFGLALPDRLGVGHATRDHDFQCSMSGKQQYKTIGRDYPCLINHTQNTLILAFFIIDSTK